MDHHRANPLQPHTAALLACSSPLEIVARYIERVSAPSGLQPTIDAPWARPPAASACSPTAWNNSASPK